MAHTSDYLWIFLPKLIWCIMLVFYSKSIAMKTERRKYLKKAFLESFCLCNCTILKFWGNYNPNIFESFGLRSSASLIRIDRSTVEEVAQVYVTPRSRWKIFSKHSLSNTGRKKTICNFFDNVLTEIDES